MASLNDFIDPDLTSADVLHSSGYVSRSGIGGGGGGLSLEKRRQLLHQPRIVGAYNRSLLGRRYGAAKSRTADESSARVYDASSDQFDDTAQLSNRKLGGIKDPDSIDPSITKRQHFIEPPSRKYNPYG